MKFLFLIILFPLNIFCYQMETLNYNVAGKSVKVNAVKGQLIVRIDKDREVEIKNKLKSKGYKIKRHIYKDFYLVITDKSLTYSLNSLKDSDIEAYPNKIYKPLYIPSDPDVSKQYYLKNIHAFSAFDYEEYNSTITVCVVDAGVDSTHSELNSVLYDTQTVVDANTAAVSTETKPFNYSDDHGTYVSGVIGALRDNANGISGILKGSSSYPVKIYSIDVFRNGGGTTTDDALIAALSYIKDNLNTDYYGKVVINMSLGGPGDCSSALQTVVDDLYNYASGTKFILVAASGNDGGAVNSPANCRNIIAAGAVDSSDNLAYFSSYGSAMLDNGLVAPGVSIYTTAPADTYLYKDGTSFASPIVASVLGFVWAKKTSLTNSEVINLVKKNAIDLGDEGPDTKYGWGRVDLYKVVSYLESDLNDKYSRKILVWPNPFKISTNKYVKFSVSKDLLYPDIALYIYNFNGEFVARVKRNGVEGYIWDGKNEYGEYVAPGPYVVYLKSDKGNAKTKFMVLR